MKLLIRSQDKLKLCEAHDLIIRENRNEDNMTNYEIQDIYTMGRYSTKERALEVLDEIQVIAAHCLSCSQDGSISYYNTTVYEMPDE